MLCWVAKFIHKVQPHNHSWLVIWFLTCWWKEFNLAVPTGNCTYSIVCRSGAVHSLTEGESRNPQPILTKDNIDSCQFSLLSYCSERKPWHKWCSAMCCFSLWKGIDSNMCLIKKVIDVSGIKINEKTTIVHSEIQT